MMVKFVNVFEGGYCGQETVITTHDIEEEAAYRNILPEQRLHELGLANIENAFDLMAEKGHMSFTTVITFTRDC